MTTVRPFCDIEFGHHEVDLATFVTEAEEIRRSAVLAQRLCDRFDTGGVSYITSVLFDDKRAKNPISIATAMEALAKVVSRPAVNRALLESRLVEASDAFVSTIQQRNRHTIHKELTRYQQRGGSLACSQDIAIWSLVRLGCIAPPTFASSSYGFSSSVTLQPRLLISVIPARFQEFEDMADAKLLRFACSDGIRQRMLRLYFGPSANQAEEAALDRITEIVAEKARDEGSDSPRSTGKENR